MSKIRSMPDSCRHCESPDMQSDGIRIWCESCGNQRPMLSTERRQFLREERLERCKKAAKEYMETHANLLKAKAYRD